MDLGGTILSAAIQVSFEKLASREVVNFFRKSKIDQTLVSKLKRHMSAAEMLILDAEQQQLTNQKVREWFDELKHWVYRAEEIIDDIATDALHSSFETKVRKLIRAFSSSTYAETVTQNIKVVVDMLEIMLSEKENLGLREVSVDNRSSQRVPTTSFIVDSKVYGRHEECKVILEFLSQEERETDRIGVLTIVGMGGIGKTTLAKLVFNHESLKGIFDLKVWVCVSDHFDVSRVTRLILESVTQQLYSASADLNFLQNELSGKLKEKRFLLVLDDVWSEKDEDWESLHDAFSVGAKDSKIIVTTRIEGVASTVMSTTPVFRLKPLSDTDGRCLFFRCAFGVGSATANPTLECIGRKIVDRCQGLPLAIKTLGGMLRGVDDIRKWEKVLSSRVWELPKGKSNIIPALWLSYYHLPPHLKRCFAYCAIFPKDYVIDCKHLVLLWKAENFVLSNNCEASIENIRNEYVQELLSTSFLEPVDESHVALHDLMHDLAEVVSGDFIARQEPGESPSSVVLSERVRHFSYDVEIFDGISKFQALHKTKYIRTFLRVRRIVEHPLEERNFLAKQVTTELIPCLCYLRVLSLAGYEIFELPDNIGCLKQLRYLDVSHSKIKQLPESVSTLYNLQTLVLSDCQYLGRLPEDTAKLASLHHLDLSGTSSLLEMPKQMSKLSGLQTLTSFVLGENRGSDITELRELRQIRGEFALRRLQNVATPSDALHANLSGLKHIKVLSLEFDVDSNDNHPKQRQEQLLDNLEPPTDLEALTVKNYAGKILPKWLDPWCVKFTKITFLCLCGCLHCHSLPPLGRLPSLKQLEIEGLDQMATLGHEFYGHNDSIPFPVLEGLSFKNMKGWVMWSNVDMKGNIVFFPCLKKLCLSNCPKLEGDLRIHAPLLEELEISGCGRLSETVPFSRLTQGNLFEVNSITRLRLVDLVFLTKLPQELLELSSLMELTIVSCKRLRSLANLLLPPKLQFLEIRHCELLESLPNRLGFLAHLDHVGLIDCPCISWVEVTGFNLPTSLRILMVFDCWRWEFPIQPEKLHEYTSLEQVWLHFTAPNLVLFPLGFLPNLAILSLKGCEHLEKVYIPDQLTGEKLASLRFLQIDCPKLEMIGKTTVDNSSLEATASELAAPNLRVLLVFRRFANIEPLCIETEGGVLLPKLYVLTINTILSSSRTPWRSLLRFSCLTKLEIYDHQEECFPNENLGLVPLPTSLTQLWIGDSPKLRHLDGRALECLTSLRQLWIFKCPQLQCLPKGGLPPSLGLLSITACPKLEKRCKRKSGEDWPMIKQLPCVLINSFILVPDTHGKAEQFVSRCDPFAFL